MDLVLATVVRAQQLLCHLVYISDLSTYVVHLRFKSLEPAEANEFILRKFAIWFNMRLSHYYSVNLVVMSQGKHTVGSTRGGLDFKNVCSKGFL